MREIGEQWVENGRMYKAVEGESCKGCTFGMMQKGSGLNDIHVCDREADCPLEYSNTVVKDLGPVNEDGLLACPFCGEFPTIKEELDENDVRIYSVEHECESVVITTGWSHDKQEVKDTWNRRT